MSPALTPNLPHFVFRGDGGAKDLHKKGADTDTQDLTFGEQLVTQGFVRSFLFSHDDYSNKCHAIGHKKLLFCIFLKKMFLQNHQVCLPQNYVLFRGARRVRRRVEWGCECL